MGCPLNVRWGRGFGIGALTPGAWVGFRFRRHLWFGDATCLDDELAEGGAGWDSGLWSGNSHAGLPRVCAYVEGRQNCYVF